MKSRLPRRRERAAIARRMGRTLHGMATENAREDEEGPVASIINGLLSSTAMAGGAAVVVLWQGAALTLGHVIVVAAGVAGAVGLIWRWQIRRHRTS
jgi:NADPH-dependent curcumin reductase CurA